VYIPPLDSLRGIHVALTEVIDALAHGQIEPRAAGQMLYGLQQTTSVLRAMNEEAEWQDDDLDDTDDSRIREFPNFEAQYGLPFGLDLEAPPEVALQKAEDNPVSTPPPQSPQPVTKAAPARAVRAQKRSSDDGPSYNDLREQLQFIEDAVRRHEQERKPPTSIALEEDEEAADTA